MPSPKDPRLFQLYIQKQRQSHLGKTSPNKGLKNTPKHWMKRFNQKYKIMESGCWDWTAHIEKTGYGEFWFNDNNTGAHVFSYQFFNGVIPKGMDVDHLCKNKKCVNPNHLDLVTRRENVLRGTNLIMKNSSKTHCTYNHPYSNKNTYITKEGFRQCHICNKFRNSVRKLSRKYLKKGVIIKWL